MAPKLQHDAVPFSTTDLQRKTVGHCGGLRCPYRIAMLILIPCSLKIV